MTLNSIILYDTILYYILSYCVILYYTLLCYIILLNIYNYIYIYIYINMYNYIIIIHDSDFHPKCKRFCANRRCTLGLFVTLGTSRSSQPIAPRFTCYHFKGTFSNRFKSFEMWPALSSSWNLSSPFQGPRACAPAISHCTGKQQDCYTRLWYVGIGKYIYIHVYKYCLII